MKKAILIALSAAATLAATAPALAQPFYASHPAPIAAHYGDEISDRIDRISDRVSERMRAHDIRWNQAQQLQAQLSRVRDMELRFKAQNRGYLAGWQRMQLNQRLDQIAQQLRVTVRR